ncbi:MAG: L-idonate 5-dehydrogenase [Alphaproteobacteria bacterium]|nr:L-idonate 5-dehydrogenase [Alphaproteobacteria bacterium]
MNQACVIYGARDLRLEGFQSAPLGETSVKVRVRAGGICGSDLHYYFEGRNGDYVIKEPLIPGHEFAGEVEAVGPRVTRVKPGDRVAVNPSSPCGRCRYCRQGRENLCRRMVFLGSASKFPHIQGGFREVFVVEEANALPVARELPFTTAAFAEPLSVALHAVARAGNLFGKTVLVTGAGPIGQLVLLCVKRAGAARIVMTDVVDQPLATARKLGAEAAINVAKAAGDLKDYAAALDGFEVVFECAGNAHALRSAFESAGPGAVIVQVGILPSGDIPILANLAMGRELEWRNTFRFCDEFSHAVDVLARGVVDVSPLLTAAIPAAEAARAFELARDRTQSLKVQITF